MSILRGEVRPSLRLVLLAGACSALLAIGLILFAGSWVRSLNDGFESLRWRMQAGGAITASERPVEQRVVLVDIDNASLAQLGTWPWPRSTTAQLLNQLAKYQPSVVGMDMAFPDATTPAQDDALSAAMAKLVAQGTPLVVGQIFDSRLDPAIRVGSAGTQVDYQALCAQGNAPQSAGYLGFFGQTTPSGVQFGHLGSTLANSGWVRSVPAVVCHQGLGMPSLALQMLGALSVEVPQVKVLPTSNGWGPAGVVEYAIQGRELPVSGNGQVLVPYSTARSQFIAVSAKDLLASPSATLPIPKGAVVLVGSTAFGLVDSVATPLSDNVGGFEVHAQLLVGALDGQVPVALAETTSAQIVLVLVALAVACAMVTLGLRLPMVGRKGAVVAWVSLPVGIGVGLFAPYWLMSASLVNPVWPWAAPVMFALCFVAGSALLEAGRLGKAFSQAYSVLGTFFASSEDADEAQLAFKRGESQSRLTDMTLLAVRMRNFSRLVSHVGAAQSSEVLQKFYEDVTEVCHDHRGVVLEFLGDTVLCGFPLENGAHPDESEGNVLNPAMQAAQQVLEAHWMEGQPELSELCLIASLEQGSCLIGLLGHRKRRASVVVGEAVSAVLGLLDLCTENSEALCVGQGYAQAHGLNGIKRVEGTFSYPATQAVAVPLNQSKYRFMGQFMLAGAISPVGVWAAQPPASWLKRNAEYLDIDQADSQTL